MSRRIVAGPILRPPLIRCEGAGVRPQVDAEELAAHVLGVSRTRSG